MVWTKKWLLALLFVLIVLCSSCDLQKETVYDVQLQGKIFRIDTINSTITCDSREYSYKVNGNKITVTYPDQVTYLWTQEENAGYGGYGGLNGSFDESRYVSGELLVSALSSELLPASDGKNYLFIIILMLLGAWNAISPYSSWYLSHGWRYRNAEPSDAVLTLTRVGGIIAVGAGILMIFLP